MKRYALAIIAIFALTSAAKTPENGPLPAPKPAAEESAPEKAKEQKASEPASEPVKEKPEQTPGKPAEGEKIPVPAPDPVPEKPPVVMPVKPEVQESVPEKPPVPEAKPDAPKAEQKQVDDTKAEKAEAPEPVQPEDQAAYSQCLVALEATGAKFRPLEKITSDQACGIDKPLELIETGGGIKLEPAATMRCETALALSRWTTETAVPAARIAFPDRKIATIANASSYVCRNRNSASEGKISEHARGNAIDISEITFAGGEKLVMKPRIEDSDMDGAFQRTLTAAACLFFTTVLSPGSDATHQDHLHMDVMKRKGGFRYCR